MIVWPTWNYTKKCRGEPFALATFVAHGGSSPRTSGVKMLVRYDGSSLGTVGGGRVETETLEAAGASLSGGDTRCSFTG